MVTSAGLTNNKILKLKDFVRRMHKNYNYYALNDVIKGTLDFLEIVIND